MDKASLFSQGQKYLQKGQPEKALKEFEKILELDPDDAKIHIQIGDIYNRLGRREESLEAYFKAADLFIQGGFGQKAIAVYKQALNLDPGSSEIHLKLADLYLKANLIPEAVKHFELVAQTCESDGLLDDALDIYSQLFALDPQRKHFLLKQGEILFKKGETQQAVRVLEPLEKGYAADKNTELLVSLYELTLTYDPANLHALGELTRLLAAEKQWTRIVDLLQKPVENGVIQISAVHLRLCEALEQSGNKPGALRQYLALYNRCQLHDPEPELLKKILAQIVRLDPENQQAKIDLRELSSKAQLSEETVPVSEAALRAEPPFDGNVPWRSAEASGTLSAQQWADKVDLLLKYKIGDLAEDCLREALRRFPDDAALNSRSGPFVAGPTPPPSAPLRGQPAGESSGLTPPPEPMEEIEIIEESPLEITAQPAAPPSAGAAQEALEEPILLEDEAEPSHPHFFEEEAPPAAPASDLPEVSAAATLDLSPLADVSYEAAARVVSPETPLPQPGVGGPPLPEAEPTAGDPYHDALALYFLGRYEEAIQTLASAGNGAAGQDLRGLVLKLACRREAGQWVELVDDAANALSIHGHEEDRKLYLLYEAALAYEQLGRIEDAIGCHEEILRLRPGYRDVSDRLQNLSPAPAAPMPELDFTPATPWMAAEGAAPSLEEETPGPTAVPPRFNVAYI